MFLSHTSAAVLALHLVFCNLLPRKAAGVMDAIVRTGAIDLAWALAGATAVYIAGIVLIAKAPWLTRQLIFMHNGNGSFACDALQMA